MTAEPLPVLDDAAALSFEYDDVRLACYAWWAALVAVEPSSDSQSTHLCSADQPGLLCFGLPA